MGRGGGVQGGSPASARAAEGQAQAPTASASQKNDADSAAFPQRLERALGAVDEERPLRLFCQDESRIGLPLPSGRRLTLAGVKPHSLPKAAVKAAVLNHRVLVSERTYAELENKLLQAKFDAYVSWEERIQFLELYLLTAETIPVTTVINACRDPNDNLFLELAVDGQAPILITGDADLLARHPFRDVAILTPEAALKHWMLAE